MKTKPSRACGWVLAPLLAFTLGSAGCGGDADGEGSARSRDAAPHMEAGRADGGHGPGHSTDAGPVDEPADMSVFHLTSRWTDQTGTVRELDELGGRMQVVALVYTRCAFACPRVIADMKRIEAASEDVGFVLVSIDPARDTPEQLRSFAEGARLSPERWTLLTGDDGDLLELAAVLGIRYRRVSENDFMHSNVLTVLDEDGEIVHRQMGLGRVQTTLDALRARRPG